ncbi:efflux RND transporter periplasmic adaptor subunit [Thiovibrio frasassiensis]|uniref:Efflux RND transporter periplasmic adaptor subunit n=1 Tax=Thiovibrio frasassiensis TaxID=2984131 RepID=A0A9X4RM14_9BACT|nr:efflux RND transporter periplasmic adaptor subunit [Thiovibrio frasassiensis]MDG4475895.1 efflux RND transporter periplasmic adaptor subunit [Thiovibrio frasassiensis]
MKKRILLSILGLLLVIGLLAGIKGLQIFKMVGKKNSFVPPPETVTTAKAHSESWERTLSAVGSLEAAQGVTVAAELPGKVSRIDLTPGTWIQTGSLLLQQDTSSEEAQLKAAEAQAALAKVNFERLRQLIETHAVSQAAYDEGEAKLREAAAQADTIRATIAKKTIRAPFSGRLGIRLVNLGQILKEGDPIVSLQAMDPIFINFMLPQQDLARIQPGLAVRITSDALPGEAIAAKITAINPQADSATRNVRVQATAANKDERLHPGMFASVAVVLPGKNQVVALPATAILPAPYGDSVFVVEERKDEKTGTSGLAVRQQFVRIGEKRGDFVAIVSGLDKGATVVSSGVFKLRNGQSVVVDNTLTPKFSLTPKPNNS